MTRDVVTEIRNQIQYKHKYLNVTFSARSQVKAGAVLVILLYEKISMYIRANS